MTFVAVLHADSCPLIVVDSLVSRPANAAAGVATPLLPNPDTRPGLGYQPVGLGRKFWLLPDRSLFLYAGTVGSARKLFDHLSTLLSPVLRYDREMHQLAMDFRATRSQGDFSFLVIVPTEDEIELYADGTMHQDDIPTYGYVVAIGSGAKEGLDILRRYPGRESQSFNDLLGTALNAAARMTQDYKDDWGNGSKMSAASCGGYFEVIPPALYKKQYEHLYRGAVQLFLDCDRQGNKLSRFVAANQGDDKTVIVAGSGLAIPVESRELSIDGACLSQFIIHPQQQHTVIAAPFNGDLTFAHIAFLTIYAHVVPDCGLREHAFRTHTVSVREGDIVAVLLEDDSPELVDPTTGERLGAGRVKFEIIANDRTNPLYCILARIEPHRHCTRCAPGAQL